MIEISAEVEFGDRLEKIVFNALTTQFTDDFEGCRGLQGLVVEARAG